MTTQHLNSLADIKNGHIFPYSKPSVAYHATSMYNLASILRDGLTKQHPFNLTDAWVMIDFLRSEKVKSFDTLKSPPHFNYFGYGFNSLAERLDHYCKSKRRISLFPYDVSCLKYINPHVVGGQAWHLIKQGATIVQNAVEANSVKKDEVPPEIWDLENHRVEVQSQNGLIVAVDLSLTRKSDLELDRDVIHKSNTIPKECIVGLCEVRLSDELNEKCISEYHEQNQLSISRFYNWLHSK